ncbi:sorting nexin-24-like [Lytechinus variegatus]|uniref:sorting nexin-24-like n=1 Tax=Lytechinus variegatus TaxID=7654 RepID=UPI001BB1890A|nr:sorting nexin-24-like [Lytechinus variegatus]
MIQVSIPGFRQIVSDDERPYTVYQINVKVSGRIHSIDKRYREFHALHKQVKKKFDTPDFPPKKVRQLSSRGMEQRRVALEAYLQGLLDKDSIPKSLLTFLHVKNFRAISYDSLDDLDTKETSTHQPVMSFESDPFLNASPPEGGIPDILTEGVRQGLYDDPESSSSAS